MKIARIFAVLVATSVAGSLFGQVTLAKWTFEVNTPPDLANSTTITGIAADIGTGTASGIHASAATDWTTPVGNASSNSLSVNTWNSGDYFQFTTSTTGYENISVSWDQTGSSTGPTAFKLAYSTNGTSFTDFASYSVVLSTGTNIIFSDLTTGSSWSATKTATNTTQSYNLSAISSLNSITGVYFRLITTSSPAAGGTNRVDNFTITGTAVAAAVPEPSTYAAIIGAVALVGAAVHRRRQRGKAATV